jgi:hypothetical protein
MLSDNLRIIADLLGEQWAANKDEIHKMDNGAMTLAYGYAIGLLHKEANKIDDEDSFSLPF